MLLNRALVATAIVAWTAAPVLACQNTGSFDRWVQNFKADAAAAGISQRTIDAALANVSFNPKVIAFDRKQHVFSQDFLTFAGRMVNKNRLAHGEKNLRKYARYFKAAQQQFGVPGPVITAFWGLETDFGANTGNFDTLSSLATLAYDCRRPEKFHPELIAALQVIDRGDLTAAEMKGAWAGELGQTQFLPTHYVTYAVDFDSDGRRDLIKDVPDVIGSTANYLGSRGWHAGEPWLEEVRVPANLPWEQADVTIRLPRSQWAKWGVTYASGKPLPADGAQTALLLPMGRNGPAFLAYRNFDVYLDWNESLVYTTSAAYFATRLAGAPPMSKGRAPVDPLSYEEIVALQKALVKRGYHVGKVDGIIGSATRAAVRDVQLKLGLPADSYPTPDLLARLR